MQILPSSSSELANHPYKLIQPGVYACPEAGRVLFVEDNETAILVIREKAPASSLQA